MKYIEVVCEECDGEGSYEYGPECSMPASMCCGGCYSVVSCEECEGKGYIEVEDWDDEEEEE
jgi:hypothetical protein